MLARHWIMLFMKQVLPKFLSPLALFGRLGNPLTEVTGVTSPFNLGLLVSSTSLASLSAFSSSYSRHLDFYISIFKISALLLLRKWHLRCNFATNSFEVLLFW